MADHNSAVPARSERDDSELGDTPRPQSVECRPRPRFAVVYVDVPISCEGPAFHYEIPAALEDTVKVGSRVKVPFGGRTVSGWVAGFVSVPEVDSVKPILSLLDAEPSLDEGAFDLARLVGERYQCPMSEIVKAMVPAYARNSPTKRRRRGAAATGSPESPADVQKHEMEPGGGRVVAVDSQIILTPEQARAVEAVKRIQRGRQHAVFVLFGVTGSGKTEVYLRAIEEALLERRQAIMLVPEIALTPQTVDRLRSRFGSNVAVLHSGVSRRDGYETYKRVRSGGAQVVLGARSAVFAPCPDPGVIVLDEEHEFTYKQSEEPRYHAREVAIMRSSLVGGITLLGSATPSIETFFRAKKGQYELVTLPSRIKGLDLPSVRVVDMRKVFSTGAKGIISPVLGAKMKETLSRGGKIILFVNRRGYSPFVLCRECGHAERCPNCEVSLTFHLKEKAMICHYCGYRKPPPTKCPVCGGRDITLFGVGTERVEQAAKVAFRDARVARLDSDTTAKRGAHRTILDAFRSGPVNVLVGTQMVAKGLDISEVALVGVISADTTLHLPDFRAAERTFQMVTQVAGRAGRGPLGGEVVVQTFNPDHYSIRSASLHDYCAFYDREIRYREELGYPPFSHLANIWVSAPGEEEARRAAQEVAGCLGAFTRDGCKSSERDFTGERCTISGPVPAPLYELRNRFRWLIMLEAPDWSMLCGRINQGLGRLPRSVTSATGVRISVDVDPVDML